MPELPIFPCAYAMAYSNASRRSVFHQARITKLSFPIKLLIRQILPISLHQLVFPPDGETGFGRIFPDDFQTSSFTWNSYFPSPQIGPSNAEFFHQPFHLLRQGGELHAGGSQFLHGGGLFLHRGGEFLAGRGIRLGNIANIPHRLQGFSS